MEQRFLGRSGFKVPALGFGAGTFGGQGPLFSAWGNTGTDGARRIVDIALDAGVNLFDTADVYSNGASETILGAALKGRRDKAIVSTKLSLRAGDGPNQVGASRHHLVGATEAALKRLGTDYIDILQLHAFDAMTPVEQVLGTLDALVKSGKVRYIGMSNFSGWQLMKSLAASDRLGLERYVANQTYYSLVGRDYEFELMPLGLDQGVGAIVWSPLGWGRLTGKIRRGQPLPAGSRLHETAAGGRRAPLPRRRRDGHRGRGDRQDPCADRAQLAAAAAHRGQRADRRARRGAADAEPRRARLAAERRADGAARCGQRDRAALSLLPVLERAVRGAQPGGGAGQRAGNGRLISPADTKRRARIHLVTTHFSPRVTGALACSERASTRPSSSPYSK